MYEKKLVAVIREKWQNMAEKLLFITVFIAEKPWRTDIIKLTFFTFHHCTGNVYLFEGKISHQMLPFGGFSLSREFPLFVYFDLPNLPVTIVYYLPFFSRMTSLPTAPSSPHSTMLHFRFPVRPQWGYVQAHLLCSSVQRRPLIITTSGPTVRKQLYFMTWAWLQDAQGRRAGQAKNKSTCPLPDEDTPQQKKTGRHITGGQRRTGISWGQIE